jgi:hypothetical protein
LIDAPSKASSVVLPVSISLDELQRQANQGIAAQFGPLDENKHACMPGQGAAVSGTAIRIARLIDCGSSGLMMRGPISVGGSGRDLIFSAPIWTEPASLSGGKFGQPAPGTADGKVDAAVAISIDTAPGWSPQVALNAKHRWADPFAITLFGTRIALASGIDPQNDEQLRSFRSTVARVLSQLRMDERAEEIWRKGFIVNQVSASPSAWVRFTPQETGLPDYEIEGRTLKAQVALTGLTEIFVGSKPPQMPLMPPNGLSKDLKPSGFDLFVPIAVSYQGLAQAASRALDLGHERIVNVDRLGDVRIAVHEIALHQTTGRKLAIGVKLSAKPPQSFLATNGTIWLVGDVNVDNATRRLSIQSLDISSQTDNKAFDFLVSLAGAEAFKKTIRSALSYDFGRDYERALAESPKILTRNLGDGLQLEGKLVSASVEQIQFGPDGIVLSLAAKGDLRLAVGNP